MQKTGCVLPCARPTYELKVQEVYPRIEVPQDQQQSASEAEAKRRSFYGQDSVYGFTFAASRGKWTVRKEYELYGAGSAVSMLYIMI